jgi:hypothetical protein
MYTTRVSPSTSLFIPPDAASTLKVGKTFGVKDAEEKMAMRRELYTASLPEAFARLEQLLVASRPVSPLSLPHYENTRFLFRRPLSHTHSYHATLSLSHTHTHTRAHTHTDDSTAHPTPLSHHLITCRLTGTRDTL